MVIPFAGCASDTSGKTDGENTESAGTANTEDTGLTPDVPDKNYSGASFTFFDRNEEYTGWQTIDCYAEQQNGEPINDAVWQRNSVVEDKFNIVIKELRSGMDMDKTLYNSVMAGEYIYDACMMRGTHSSLAAQNGSLFDLYSVNYIDLSKPWWDQNANSDFYIGGKLYFTCSDISISDKDGSWAMGFNKRLLEDNSLENPYDLVKNNLWTIDKMYEMAKTVSYDLDGDGIMTKDDVWGITAEGYDTYAMFFAGGERIFKNNAEGYPGSFSRLGKSSKKERCFITRHLSLIIGANQNLLN